MVKGGDDRRRHGRLPRRGHHARPRQVPDATARRRLCRHFLRQLEPVAGEIAARGIKVVVNAGGLDPAGLAQATREMLRSVGVDLAVAHVEGDDLAERIPELMAAGVRLDNLDTGAPFSEWGHDVLTANAYLGGFGIKAALDGGADIVITGRVADASLASGSAAWWWGWSTEDHDRLAGAVVAGHIIECGAQATGGNFSGFREIDDLEHPGFPLAEIDQDGSSVITKHPGTGGAVSVDTVTAQLLYEVGGPDYLNPDVVARLDTVRLEQLAPDRVAVRGVRGKPPPRTTKVAITGLGSWRNSTTVVLTGLDLDQKAALLERSVGIAPRWRPRHRRSAIHPDRHSRSRTRRTRWRARACCTSRSTVSSRAAAARSRRSSSSWLSPIFQGSITRNPLAAGLPYGVILAGARTAVGRGACRGRTQTGPRATIPAPIGDAGVGNRSGSIPTEQFRLSRKQIGAL